MSHNDDRFVMTDLDEFHFEGVGPSLAKALSFLVETAGGAVVAPADFQAEPEHDGGVTPAAPGVRKVPRAVVHGVLSPYAKAPWRAKRKTVTPTAYATKSQTAEDSAGRTYCYDEGVGRVPCQGNEQAPTAPSPAGGEIGPQNATSQRQTGAAQPAPPPDAAGARKHIAELGRLTLAQLKKAGAAARHVEHVAKEYAADKVASNVAKLPPKVQALCRGTFFAARLGTAAAFASYTAGQKAAEVVARRRGATPEQAAKLRQTLAGLDVALAKPVVLAMHALPGGQALTVPAGFVPVASMSYLAYTGADAAARAAWRAVAAGAKKAGLKELEDLPPSRLYKVYGRYRTKAEERTDSAGHHYCVEEGQGRVPCQTEVQTPPQSAAHESVIEKFKLKTEGVTRERFHGASWTRINNTLRKQGMTPKQSTAAAIPLLKQAVAEWDAAHDGGPAKEQAPPSPEARTESPDTAGQPPPQPQKERNEPTAPVARTTPLAPPAETNEPPRQETAPPPEPESTPAEVSPLQSPPAQETPEERRVKDKLINTAFAFVDSGTMRPARKKEIKRLTNELVNNLSAAAAERLGANVSSIFWHANPKEMEARLRRFRHTTVNKHTGGAVGGMCVYAEKAIYLMDSGVPDGAAAHEMTHGIDGASYELSGSPEWKEAYEAEIAGGQLTAYAANNTKEGLCEFGRLVMTGFILTNRGSTWPAERIEAEFPKCLAFWRARGILPKKVGYEQGRL